VVDNTLEMTRCGSCHAEFSPRPGPCPRCGSTQLEGISVPAQGTVCAATELSTPATGWETPHRLALVEIADGIRLLCVVKGTLPAAGNVVKVSPTGAIYLVE
jgi:uncharacterized OB-fold protein